MRCLLILLAWMASLPLQAADLPAPVAAALARAGIPLEAAAIYVRRVDQAQPLVAHQAAQPMNPASTMKLLTTYAGLERLGPAYAWKTEVYATNPVKEGVLDGDLVLKGYGDPALTLPSFWELLRNLRRTGLREIRGDLVLDLGYFEPMATDPGSFDGEPWRAYNATPDALLVNFKATRFDFHVEQEHVVVTADPDMPQLKLVNRLALNDGACNDWKKHLAYRVTNEADQVAVNFDGGYARACGDKDLSLSLFDDSRYVHQLFAQLWHEQGGLLAGKVRTGSASPQAQLLLQTVSPPLADVVRMINKNSNNLMAKQLLLTLGAEAGGPPATAEKGAAAVRGWLAAKGMEMPELVLENGAGLSRIERISAEHLGELLISAWNSPVMAEFMSSLPIVAVDGTMEHRLQNTMVAGEGHLKTGSLEGVRALAGYLRDQEGRRWVVVFIVNHAQAAASREAQDALLQWLYERTESKQAKSHLRIQRIQQ